MRVSFRLSGSDWRIMGLMPTEWVWRRLQEADCDLDNLRPAAPPWVPATVPGDVQSDLRDAGEIPDPWFERNSRACEWTSQRDWVYRKEFVPPPEMRNKARIGLRFGGVDFSCHVFLNGNHLGDHVGMYDPFAFDVTETLRWDAPNRLLVVIDRAPLEPENQGQIGWTNQIRLWKARFAYDWDWCTRLVPLGIWQDVWLEADEGVRIEEVWVRPLLQEESEEEETFAVARVSCRLRLASETEQTVQIQAQITPVGGGAEWTSRKTVALRGGKPQIAQITRRIPNPRLWYPNGYGEQPLYQARITIRTPDGELLDEWTERFGIRQARFVPNDNAPEDALPYTLEINGVKTFIKGWNWVPIDQLYGRPHTEKYRRWIRLVKEANCNLLRVWGGGLLEREIFYDLCDEAGILVWQEFIQSSSGIDNEPAKDAAYIATCRDQAAKMIPQKRNHPSLVLWCGGNELMTPDFVPLTNSHPTIAALRETVERLDPDRPFLPTSPSGPLFGADAEKRGQMHDVHGDWTYRGDPDHYHFYNAIDPLLHSEFGVEGAANLDALARFLSPESLWPPDPTNPNWAHHGNWWLHRPAVEKLFGPIDNLADYVHASQWLQAEGLRYSVEANRRRMGRTSGTIPWQFNEAWPNASCTNVVDYYGQPKPAYWWIRRAYAPMLVSARYEKLQWEPGEEFRAEVWLSRAGNIGEILGGKARVPWRLTDLLTGRTLAEGFAAAPLVAAETPICLLTIRHRLPKDYRGVFALTLSGLVSETLDVTPERLEAEHLLERNEYLFSTGEGAPFASLLRMPPARLQTRRVPDKRTRPDRILSVRNAGETPALYVTLSLPDAPLFLLPDSNYRTLLPNETRWFYLSSDESDFPERARVSVSAWNVTSRALEL